MTLPQERANLQLKLNFCPCCGGRLVPIGSPTGGIKTCDKQCGITQVPERRRNRKYVIVFEEFE